MRKMKNMNSEDIGEMRSMEIWKIGNGKNGKFTVSWNLISFCPRSVSNILRNYFVFRSAGYVLKFNFF